MTGRCPGGIGHYYPNTIIPRTAPLSHAMKMQCSALLWGLVSNLGFDPDSVAALLPRVAHQLMQFASTVSLGKSINDRHWSHCTIRIELRSLNSW